MAWGIARREVVNHLWVIARNTCPILCHTLRMEVVLCHKYYKNNGINLKFGVNLTLSLKNILEIFEIFGR